jgi:hypothetical protein
MDPIQQIYLKIKSADAQAKSFQNSQQASSGDVAAAYSTIAAVHLSTSSGLASSLQNLILQNISSSK